MLEVKELLQSKIAEILSEWNITGLNIQIDETDDLSRGDLACNVALQLSRELGRNPREIAQDIVTKLGGVEYIEKIEVAGPGFINFYLSESYLTNMVRNIVEKKDEAFKLNSKAGENLVIEYTDPNPFKVFHIGHLYTNMVGESFARLQEALGGNVKRAIYQGDVGLHVAKTMWGLWKIIIDDKEMSFEEIRKLSLSERVGVLGNAYSLGNTFYEDEEQDDGRVVKGDKLVIGFVRNVNYYIFSLYIPSLEKKEYFKELEDMGVKEWYMQGKDWCMEYFENIYKRTGTKFDYYFLESEMGERGLKLVQENTDPNGLKVFRDDEGSVIYEGDPEKGLHTRVFINKDHLPTYEAKELGLALAKSEKVDYDESVIITADEQSGYFKVVLDALSQLKPELANATKHMAHGMVKLPGSTKMSSRKGNILGGEWLLDSTKERIESVMKESGKWSDEDIKGVSDTIAVAAIKYAFLKVTVGKDVIYDIDKSISFDGDTGPYLLYVYARCSSLLEGKDVKYEINDFSQNTDEKDLIRKISKFDSILLTSGVEYSPSTLCSYLFDLGQAFNKFYQSEHILGSDREEELLTIVQATAQTMKYGLNLLGINTVDHM